MHNTAVQTLIQHANMPGLVNSTQGHKNIVTPPVQNTLAFIVTTVHILIYPQSH